ncbi:hypothetical protein CRG98_042567 [Punica granatum]|uniref:Uncharacterized protein n=1 Tax=Punica granatum TaxID=22663 RepID=A0A2I0HZ90_PUNGR|nr:hypothetical protein CRG98_042567 [Punica granatum]
MAASPTNTNSSKRLLKAFAIFSDLVKGVGRQRGLHPQNQDFGKEREREREKGLGSDLPCWRLWLRPRRTMSHRRRKRLIKGTGARREQRSTDMEVVKDGGKRKFSFKDMVVGQQAKDILVDEKEWLDDDLEEEVPTDREVVLRVGPRTVLGHYLSVRAWTLHFFPSKATTRQQFG